MLVNYSDSEDDTKEKIKVNPIPYVSTAKLEYEKY